MALRIPQDLGKIQYLWLFRVEASGWRNIEALKLHCLFWAWLVATTKPSTHNLIYMPNTISLASTTDEVHTVIWTFVYFNEPLNPFKFILYATKWMTKWSKWPNTYVYFITFMKKRYQDMCTYYNKLVYIKHVTTLLMGSIYDKICNKGSYT